MIYGTGTIQPGFLEVSLFYWQGITYYLSFVHTYHKHLLYIPLCKRLDAASVGF